MIYPGSESAMESKEVVEVKKTNRKDQERSDRINVYQYENSHGLLFFICSFSAHSFKVNILNHGWSLSTDLQSLSISVYEL